MSTLLHSVLQRTTARLAHFSPLTTDASYTASAVSNNDGFPAFKYEGLNFEAWEDDEDIEAAAAEHAERAELQAMVAESPVT